MCVRALSIKCSHRRAGEGLQSNVKITHGDLLTLNVCVCVYREGVSARVCIFMFCLCCLLHTLNLPHLLIKLILFVLFTFLQA